MKLLVINPNTSAFVTEKVCSVARDAAGPEIEIQGVTGRHGPPIVGTRSECAMAAQEALSLAAEYAGKCDGILLAISFDTGLDALREVVPVPVIGMSEAGMLAAMASSRRFAMLSFGNRAGPIYKELIEYYHWQDRSAGVISLPLLSQAKLEDTSLIIPQIIDAVETVAQERQAESVVLAGAVFAGIADAIQDRVSIPVIDGIAAGVHQLKMLYSLKLRKPAAGSLAYPPGKQLQDMPEPLTRMFLKF